MAEIIKKLINAEDDGIRVARWFQKHYNQYSFSNIYKLARTGQIRLDGKRIKPSDRVILNQEIRFPEFTNQEIRKQVASQAVNYSRLADTITDSIIYINSHLLVLNKPAGLAVQGGNGIEVSVDHLAKELQFDAYNKPRLVHRIDKETSGILILARTINAAQKLASIFQDRNINKKYLVITQGIPQNSKGVIDIPLKGKDSGAGFENMAPNAKGKQAITHYKVLAKTNTVALLEVAPITGRKHQIRAHLAIINCPIIGDRKYNKNYRLYHKVSPNLLLHAYQLDLELFGEKLQFTAPLPRYFIDTLQSFGLSFKKNSQNVK